MRYMEIKKIIFRSPVILAIKDPMVPDDLLTGEHQVVFLLAGNICELPMAVAKAKARGKVVIVHLDLMEGLSPRDAAIDYISRNTQADGIISTRPKLLSYAKQLGLFTILRIFLLDSMAVENVERNVAQCDPDMIEVLPGTVLNYLRKIQEITQKPVIAGGLIRTREDALAAFRGGASAVSSSSFELGEINHLLQQKLSEKTKPPLS